MPGTRESFDPIVDALHSLEIHALHSGRSERIEPFAHPAPLTVDEPALGIALIRSVRQQERNQIRHGAHSFDPAHRRALRQDPDRADAFLEALVRGFDLLREELCPRNVVGVFGIDQADEMLEC
jgi:hypothetical protein